MKPSLLGYSLALIFIALCLPLKCFQMWRLYVSLCSSFGEGSGGTRTCVKDIWLPSQQKNIMHNEISVCLPQ